MPEAILDNSAYSRIRTSEAVRAYLDGPLQTWRSVLVQRLEIGASARNVAEYDNHLAALVAIPLLPQTDDVAAAAQAIQRALVTRGTHRGPKVVDIVIAATAVVHEAEVLHYDSDDDAIQDAEPRLRARWIVPRGSID